MNVRFKHWNCTVKISKYLYGKLPAIHLVDALTQEPIATATVNLIDYGIIPPENHCYIKDYAENEGMVESLLKAGAVTYVKQISFGQFNTTATLCKLNEQLIQQFKSLT